MSISQSAATSAPPPAPAGAAAIGGGAPIRGIGAIFRSRLRSPCTLADRGDAAGAERGSIGGDVVSLAASACGRNGAAAGATRGRARGAAAAAAAAAAGAPAAGSAVYTATDLDRSFRYSCSPCLRTAACIVVKRNARPSDLWRGTRREAAAGRAQAAEQRTHVTLSERSDLPSSGIFCRPAMSRENSWSHVCTAHAFSTARLKSASVHESCTSTRTCPSGVCTRTNIVPASFNGQVPGRYTERCSAAPESRSAAATHPYRSLLAGTAPAAPRAWRAAC
jgi:hypothetical protein